jgi:hypothetical protein
VEKMRPVEPISGVEKRRIKEDGEWGEVTSNT